MIVYLTTNLINGMKYVGADTKNNPDYLGSGTLIGYEIRRLGKELFIKEILEECSNLEQLTEREAYYIKKLNTLYPLGYNLTTAGIGNRGSEIRKKKILKKTKGIYCNREQGSQFVETQMMIKKLLEKKYDYVTE